MLRTINSTMSTRVDAACYDHLGADTSKKKKVVSYGMAAAPPFK